MNNINKLINRWAQLINENQKMDFQENKLFNEITDFYNDLSEVEVQLNANGQIEIMFDDSGYDNSMYATEEFNQIIKDLQKFIDSYNKMNNTQIEFDVDRTEHCITIDEQVNENDMDKAKVLGYRGDEKHVADWLKGAYAQWRMRVLQIMTKLADGDEAKAKDWFDRYNDLASEMYGTNTWSNKQNKYIEQDTVKDELFDEMGKDKPEAIELMNKLEDKWSNDRKELIKFYSTNSRTLD